MTRRHRLGDTVARWGALAPALVLALAAGNAARAGTVELPTQVGGAFAVPVTSLREARHAATVRQLHDFSCGSAAVATLLSHHYGHPVPEQAVFDAMWALGDADKIRSEGFSLLDMKRYLATLGYEADGFDAPLDALAEARIPAIVLVDENGYHHFVVVKGLRGGRVLFGDPAAGTRAMAAQRFDAMRVNGIVFVVSNRQAQARFDLDAEWAAQPRAPLAGRADGAGVAALPKLGPSDF